MLLEVAREMFTRGEPGPACGAGARAPAQPAPAARQYSEARPRVSTTWDIAFWSCEPEDYGDIGQC